MDLHYKQEATVGVLVLGAIAIFAAGTMWLSGGSFQAGSNRVQVQFEDVGNLKRGNLVKVSGVALGSVEDIRFQDVGEVVVTLNLDEQIVPKLDATAQMRAVGLVGEVQVDFDPGRSAETLPNGTLLIGTVAKGLSELGAELGDQAQTVLSGFADIANKQLADDLHETLGAIQRLADVFSQEDSGPTAELGATLEALQQLSLRMDSVLASPALERTLANFDSVTTKLGRLTEQYTAAGARLDSILTGVQAGEGTLGRMTTDSTLYVRLSDLSASLKEFIDDLKKNPGKITVQVKIF
jgi:phospholipid/cholesterol/gamma-HCH transport system substrate-binding protein